MITLEKHLAVIKDAVKQELVRIPEELNTIPNSHTMTQDLVGGITIGYVSGAYGISIQDASKLVVHIVMEDAHETNTNDSIASTSD